VADGTIFEKRGIPAAAIITTAFTHSADAMARRHDFLNYRYAMVSHPIGNLKPDQIKERAAEALPQVLAILGLAETSD
jgi:hypothetical protein